MVAVSELADRFVEEMAALDRHREGGHALLRECMIDDQSFLDFEIDRYLGRPGQAISYKVGERVWLAVREAERRRRPAGFDLRAFHAMALDMGPMGLDTLRERLAAGPGAMGAGG